MLKYIDLDNYSFAQLSDEAFMLNEFIELKKFNELSNLVKKDIQIINLVDYVVSKFSRDYQVKFIEQKIIDNPLEFKIENGVVIEKEPYTLGWMSLHFETNKELILMAIEKLAQDISQAEKKGSHISKFIPLHDDEKEVPVLFYIAENITSKRGHLKQGHFSSVWETILKNNDSIKDYLKKTSSDNREKTNAYVIAEELSNYGYYHHQKEFDTASIFFIHEVLDDIDRYSYEKVLAQCIELDSLKSVAKILEIRNKHNWEQFSLDPLAFARSPQMATFLLEQNFTAYAHHEGEPSSFHLSRKMNLDTLDTILSFGDNAQLVKDHPEEFYFEFFKNKKDFEIMKMLVEKYHFPLEKIDCLAVGYGLEKDNKNETPYSKWFIEHGGDPKKCEQFSNQIRAEKSLLAILDRYHSLVDKFSPDIAVNLLKERKGFRQDYFDIVPKKVFHQKTIDNHPVWWSIENISLLKNIFSKDSGFKYCTDNDCWIRHAITREVVDLSFIKVNKEQFNLKDTDKYHIVYQDKNNNNFLHDIFDRDLFITHRQNAKIISFLFTETDIDFEKMLTQENLDGKSPLHLIFEKIKSLKSQKNAHHGVEKEGLFTTMDNLIKNMRENFPFEYIIDGTPVMQYIHEIFSDNYAYELYIQYHKEHCKLRIENMVQEKTGNSRKMKI